MPTVDQLPAATAAADTDELLLSQSGVATKIAREALLVGLQPEIALGQGQILGRVSAGTGGPEAISLGASLSLANGSLAVVPTPVALTTLTAGTTPSGGDLIAAAQGGNDVAITYTQLISGLPGIPGVDGSNLTARPTGASVARRIADIASDAVAVESFGAAGDGQTDDTNAFAAAFASGLPVRIGPKTYVVNGQFTVTGGSAVLIGTPGVSTLRRHAQASGGAWIAIQSTSFRADGVIFDANGGAVSTQSWGVLVTTTCTTTDFFRCGFRNAAGATLGNGLTFLADSPALTSHDVRACEFAGNAAHGVWVQACTGVRIDACRAHDNAQYGICVDYNDAAFAQKATLVQVLGCQAWNNTRGIAVGNFNATNTQPPVWGNANPDAIAVIVAGNICHDNTLYGIAVSGRALAVTGNLLSNNGAAGTGGAGILANVSWSRVAGNMITGGATYGIDCGGSIYSDIAQNFIDGPAYGINCGGSTAVRVGANTLQDCAAWSIVANNVETDGVGNNFGIACTLLAVSDNWIGLNGPSAGGILLKDGPQDVQIARNSLFGSNGANVGNCLWANTDSVVIEGNRWNATARFTANPTPIAGLQTVVYPDIADTLMITAAPAGVQSIISSFQAVNGGQLTFVRVSAGGTGYTHASVAVGGAGSGAAAVAFISGGAVIGVMVTSPGTGYGAYGAAVPITITGDGSGAAATGFAGTPIPDERRLRVRCNVAVTFARNGTSPPQDNWTLNDLTVPAYGDVDWAGTFGLWRAVRASPADVAGVLALSGSGSPQGVVAAPPGSDYRNLAGGVGDTLWIKQTGTGDTGWFAVA